MDVVGKETLETMAFAKWYNKWLYELMRQYLGKDLLEIGAGTGNFTELLLNDRKVTAIDIQKGYVEDLNQRKYKNFSVGMGDIEKGKYFFKDKKFDTAIALNVIEHINNDNRAIRNVFSLLRKNGKFVILVPAHQKLYSEMDKELGHHRRYSRDEVKDKLVEAGFLKVEVRYLNWWAAIGWYIFLKLSKTKRMPKDKVKVFDKLGKLFLLPEKYIEPPFGLSIFAVAQK